MKFQFLSKLFLFFILMNWGMVMKAEESFREAIFAGGCFWCMESPFTAISGVFKVTAGYTGGDLEHPTYDMVSRGQTGHVEAVSILYDPHVVSYDQLLAVFFHQIDPTDDSGQFVDRGQQYRPFIFFTNEMQKEQALGAVAALQKSGRFNGPIKVQIVAAKHFWPAEEYHQDFYKKSPLRYMVYSRRSGREQFIEQHWAKDEIKQQLPLPPVKQYQIPSDEELKRRLTPLQFDVAKRSATEPAFHNEYWNNKADGIYVDIVTGEPLFSSRDKYDTQCGWPSFTKPLRNSSIVEKNDNSLMMTRTEVKSKYGDTHLGHLFHDGPGPTGLRYCINSASLRFVPKDKLVAEGYGEYLKDFP